MDNPYIRLTHEFDEAYYSHGVFDRAPVVPEEFFKEAFMSVSRRPLAAVHVAQSLLVPAAHAGNEALLGKWNCAAQSSDGDLPSVWIIKESAGVVVVDVEIDGTTRAAQDVKVAGKTLTMKVGYQSVSYDVSVVFDGDTVAGTWAGDGRQGPIKGKRG